MELILLACLALQAIAEQVPLGNEGTSVFSENFDKAVNHSLHRWHAPGLAVAVVDGQETYGKGYGFAQLPNKPVTPSTLFYTGSTTKSFTSAALSLLIDDTANSTTPLSWQTPLIDLIREDFVLADDYTTSHATLEDALSHRTGLSENGLAWIAKNQTVRSVTQKLRHVSISAEIRTRWQYCNVMFMTLSYIIEKWTGQWLGHFLKTRIYEPLNMSSTFFSLQDALDAEGSDLATGYIWANYSQRYNAVPWMDSPQVSGAGATISNVLDYAKWLRCHMTKSPPLSPAGHAAVHSPHMISGPLLAGELGFRGADTYALGWEVSNYRGETMIWHTGGVPGFVTVMLYLPRLQWGLTMMANGMNGIAILEPTFYLLDDRLGIPESDRHHLGKIQDQGNEKALYILRHARDVLYPNAPNPNSALPISLPLEFYSGIYTHPAYPSLTIIPNTSTILASETILDVKPTEEQIVAVSLSLEHVLGEYFIGWVRQLTVEPRHAPHDIDPLYDHVIRVSFTIDSTGHVSALGLQLEPGEKVWFRKRITYATNPSTNNNNKYNERDEYNGDSKYDEASAPIEQETEKDDRLQHDEFYDNGGIIAKLRERNLGLVFP
ncbi:hypothetical protein ACLMJK_009142 [Lecanora helva]